MCSLRFAPSPTGMLHIGNLRIMIINYLMSLCYKKAFIIRIDDTDSSRNTIEGLKDIVFSQFILGINSSSIEYQSQYIDKCDFYANKMLSLGNAYYCICKELTSECTCESKNLKYGCIVGKVNENISFKDSTYGNLRCKKINNVIICRSNGKYLYNFISSVCDVENSVSIIVRGCDHIDNTFVQISLMKSIDNNFNLPNFTHIPMMLSYDKSKISKRCNIGLSNSSEIEDMMKSGILVESIIIYLATIGTNIQYVKIKNLQELVSIYKNIKFTTRNIEHDMNKLININKYVMKNIDTSSIGRNLSIFQMISNYKDLYKINNSIFCRYSNMKDYCDSMNMLDINYNLNYSKDIYFNYRNLIDNILNSVSPKDYIYRLLETTNKDDLPNIHKSLRHILFNTDSFMSTSEFMSVICDDVIKHRLKLIKDMSK